MEPPCVAVAYSAGRDSTALLHATLAAARLLGLRVVALHVHHGLSAHADAWLEHAQRQCSAWARRGDPVQLLHHRVSMQPPRGDSVEAWARRVRYDALATLAKQAGADTVLLGHHRRDQAETWLLQTLRSAGVDGQAAMPHDIERNGIRWMRPWLNWPRSAIEHYVRRHRLSHVDDDSNADPRWARNRLRLAVWPALEAAFPQAESAISDAARWAALAREALDELAAVDLAVAAPKGPLQMAPWRVLSEARRSNSLRAWLKAQEGRPAASSLVQRLMAELSQATTGTWPMSAERDLRLHRGVLRVFVSEKGVSARGGLALGLVSPGTPEQTLSIVRAGRFKLPGWQGEVVATRVREGGVPLAWLAHLELRVRTGGERFQAGIGRPPRSLKKQFQAADVPAWLRDGPLLYSGGQLVFVPGLGIDARLVALPGQPQLALAWQADAAR